MDNKTERNISAPRTKIEVTSSIIELSTQADSSHCMIADAVRAAIPGARFVSVDLQTIRYTDPVKSLRYIYLTPRRGQEALIKFDQGQHPEPFAFYLMGGAVARAGISAVAKAKKAKARESAKEGDPRVAGPDRTVSQAEAAVDGPARIAMRDQGEVPDRIGGRTPPIGALADPPPKRGVSAGRRRQFGLRGFER